MLRQCFDGLKLYGKQGASLENTMGLFQMVLGDYPMDKIRKAFAFYLRTGSEMPTPADIATIIERGNKPAFDKQVYGMICKKSGCDRTEAEWQYKREYESFMINGDHRPLKPQYRPVDMSHA